MRLALALGVTLTVFGLGWIWTSSSFSFRYHRDEARFGAFCMAVGAGAVAYVLKSK